MAAKTVKTSLSPRERIPYWLRGRVGNALLVLISIAFTALLIEVGAWAWIELVRPQHLTQWEFRATRPPPYRDAAYFNDDFLRESEAVVRGRLTDVLELDDYRGRYFNVQHGFRVTTDSPDYPTRRVLMFGGSTLFGQEVPDDGTIASHLQRMLNAAGVKWKVMNFGLHGMNAAQQTKILHGVDIYKGDIVVFYDGVNDIYYLVFGGYREGWVNGTPAFRPVQKLGPLHKLLYVWHQELKNYSYTADVALDIFQRGRPSTVTDPAALAGNIEIAELQFRAALAEGAKLARDKGARFVHFLQPQVFENSTMTAYERTLVDNPLLTAPGVEEAFGQGYPRLREVAQTMTGRGIAFFDISKAFDRRPPGQEIMLDFCHVNDKGNELVAREMFDRYFLPEISREQQAANADKPVRGSQSGATVPR